METQVKVITWLKAAWAEHPYSAWGCVILCLVLYGIYVFMLRAWSKTPVLPAKVTKVTSKPVPVTPKMTAHEDDALEQLFQEIHTPPPAPIPAPVRSAARRQVARKKNTKKTPSVKQAPKAPEPVPTAWERLLRDDDYENEKEGTPCPTMTNETPTEMGVEQKKRQRGPQKKGKS